VTPPLYRKHFSFSIYDGVLKDLILLFKYGEIKKLKNLIAAYYSEIFNKKICEEFDFLIPVPPDKNRKREFNPIFEIAKVLSKSINVRLLSNRLLKIKKTEPQAGLSRSKRLKNLDGAFVLKKPNRLKGKKVLLIDDVYTTGTTIKQCTKLLIKAGADVVAITLARSI
jgi:ComF family protein